MTIKYLLLVTFPLLLFTVISFAQKPCSAEDAYNKAGIWTKQGFDDLVLPDSTFPKTDFPKILAKAQEAVELIKKANPKLVGVEGRIKRSIRGRSYFPYGALPFEVSAAYKVYYCVPNDPSYPQIRGTVQINDEKGVGIGIFFNTLGWITNSDQDTNLQTSSNENIYYYPSPMLDFKGISAFRPDFTSQKNEMYVIAPSGKSPFVFVSREEYILARRKKLRQEIEKLKSDTSKNSKENEAMLAKIDSSSVYSQEQKKKLREAVEKTKPFANQMSAKMFQQFEEWDKAFDTLLQELSPAERREPAIIKNSNSVPPKDKIFVTEHDGGRKLFTINKNFFNPAQPRSNIQLITIYLFWDAKHPAETRVINQFKENFDFQALRKMLER